MERRDIRLELDEEKEKVYEQIHRLFLQGKSVKLAEHKSDFPAATLDCEDIHIIINILTFATWWGKKKKERG